MKRGFLLLACALAGQLVATPSGSTVRPCAACHPAQANPHPATSMAHALEPVDSSAILTKHPLLTFQAGQYSYRIERQANQSIYLVSDGHNQISVPLLWAFGLGSAGQTYVFKIDDQLYESRVSYYKAVNGLDLTLGANGSQPQNLPQAAGEIIKRADGVRCFGCHATNAFEGRQLTLDKMTPGIQCERCHGLSEDHMAAFKKGGGQKPAVMTKLGEMTTEQTSNFCGQCHRTWEEIAGSTTHGVVDVRFQPYGLTNSKCYDTEDKRIRCVACHNPHQEVERNDTSYDARCESCHSKGGKLSAKLCRVATRDCVSCHMPKVELPGSHYRFTDHEIRIVRAGVHAGL